MNLYYISQGVNNGYDTYDSAVVAAVSAKAAKRMHPGGYKWDGKSTDRYGVWCDAKDVVAELIGKAKLGTKRGVICASFNAG